MPRNCKCGGRLVPQGALLDLETLEEYATFKCNRCGVVRHQKKRRPKKGE